MVTAKETLVFTMIARYVSVQLNNECSSNFCYNTGLPRSAGEKSGANEIFSTVREKSVNFVLGQGNLELCPKAKTGKSQVGKFISF